jgi:predicted PurR-regulated permease PerM
MWLGVGAEGAVDIKTNLLSGRIETGSAGLFTIFFGFCTIIFVISNTTVNENIQSRLTPHRKSKAHQIVLAFWGVLTGFLICTILGALGYGPGFAFGAAFLALMLCLVGGAYVVNIDD